MDSRFNPPRLRVALVFLGAFGETQSCSLLLGFITLWSLLSLFFFLTFVTKIGPFSISFPYPQPRVWKMNPKMQWKNAGNLWKSCNFVTLKKIFWCFDFAVRTNVSVFRGALCPFQIAGCLYHVLVPALDSGESPSAVCGRASRTGLPAMACPHFSAPHHPAAPVLRKQSVIRAKFSLLQTAFTWD